MITLAHPASKAGIDWLQPLLAEARQWPAQWIVAPPEFQVPVRPARRKIELRGEGDDTMEHGGRVGRLLANTYYLIGICSFGAIAATWLASHGGTYYQEFQSYLLELRSGKSGVFLAIVARWDRELVTFLVTFAALFVPGYAIVRARRSLRRILRASASNFYVAAEFSRILIQLTECIAEVRATSGAQKVGREVLQKFLKEQRPALALLLNQIAHYFTSYTGRTCHASLKLFDARDGIKTDQIITSLRDETPESLSRSVADDTLPTYYYRENTAFKEIMNDPKKRWFVSNNLSRMAKKRRYQNAREGWEKDYTATLVVPITNQYEAENIKKDNVLGFLCIDNKGGGFDGRLCANAAFTFARITYGIMETLGQVPTR